MRPAAASVREENGQDRQQTVALPACPVCTSPMIPLRGLCRCSRCCFTFCEGCEGEVAGGYGAGD